MAGKTPGGRPPAGPAPYVAASGSLRVRSAPADALTAWAKLSVKWESMGFPTSGTPTIRRVQNESTTSRSRPRPPSAGAARPVMPTVLRDTTSG